MSPRRAKLLIVCVWILSFVICFPPLIGWNERRQSVVEHPEGTPATDELVDTRLLASDATDESEALLGGTISGRERLTWNMTSSSNTMAAEDEWGWVGLERQDGLYLTTTVSRIVAVQASRHQWPVVARFGDNSISTELYGSLGVAANETVVNRTMTVGAVCPVYALQCVLTSDPGYIIYSACGSFWVPMFVMVVFYWNIYKTAARATAACRRGFLNEKHGNESGGKSGGQSRGGGGGGGMSNSSSENSLTLRIHRGGGASRASDGCIGSTMGGFTSARPRRSFDDRLVNTHSTDTVRGANRHVIGGRAAEINSHGGGADEGSPLRQARFAPFCRQKLPTIIVTSTTSCDIAVDLDDTPDSSSPPHRSDRLQSGFRSLPGSPRVTAEGDDLSSRSSRKSSILSESSFSPAAPHNSSRSSSISPSVSSSRFTSGFKLPTKLQHILPQLRSLNKEKKAAKTVGVIVGCFIVCWAPFFTVYLFGALCPGCTPSLVFDIFFWLGYCNSAANPFIYGLCSRDFRYAFAKLLRCRCERREPQTLGNRARGASRLATMLQSLRLQIVTRRGTDSFS